MKTLKGNNLSNFEADLKKISSEDKLIDELDLHENEVSKVISWLMSDAQNNNLKQNFIKYFLENIADKKEKITFYYGKINSPEDTSIKIDNIFKNTYSVNEYPIKYNKQNGRIDIIVVDTTNNLALIIENKFGSWLHNNQLKLYEKFCLDLSRNSDMKFAFIYLNSQLTKDKNDCTNQHWITSDYEFIKEFLRKNYSKSRENEEILKSLLNHITEIQEDNICNDYSNYSKLVEKHKTIIDNFKKYVKNADLDNYNILQPNEDIKPYYYLYQKYWDTINTLIKYSQYQAIYKIYCSIKKTLISNHKGLIFSSSSLLEGRIDITLKNISDNSDMYWFLYTSLFINSKDNSELVIETCLDPEQYPQKTKLIQEKYKMIHHKTIRSDHKATSTNTKTIISCIKEHIKLLRTHWNKIRELK